MARTYKLRCERCGQVVDKYHMQMMIGSKGYRSYPVHDGQCPKVRNAKITNAAKAKAGVR